MGSITSAEYLTDMLRDLNKQSEQIMLHQLKELVDRGILVWEETQPIITSKEDGSFKIVTIGRFIPREKEYIESLEKEIWELRRFRDVIRNQVQEMEGE